MITEYYIDGERTELPAASKNERMTGSEFERLCDLVAEGYKEAMEKMPELKDILLSFDKRPAKKKFAEALEEKGFCFDGRGNIRLLFETNCVLTDDGKKVTTGGSAFEYELEHGICCCDYLYYDEEGMLDAKETISDLWPTEKRLRDTYKELTSENRQEYIDLMENIRQDLLRIRQECPEELAFHLFADLLNKEAEYE